MACSDLVEGQLEGGLWVYEVVIRRHGASAEVKKKNGRSGNVNAWNVERKYCAHEAGRKRRDVDCFLSFFLQFRCFLK